MIRKAKSPDLTFDFFFFFFSGADTAAAAGFEVSVVDTFLSTSPS